MRRTAGCLLVALGLVLGSASAARSPVVETVAEQPPPPPVVDEGPPLAGRVVVLDPGHQLGNARFPTEVNRLVPDGRGGHKACNTTGTATDAGYPEAAVTWQVTRLVEARLVRLGATVVLTRDTNRYDRWGPCVDVRGRSGNRIGADLLLSIHADGSYVPGARGFHVITAPDRPAAARAARHLRTALRQSGVPVANYIAGGDGLDVRRDLATLNLARVPAVMVELGNMRDRRDASRMTTPGGRAAYARAIVAGVVQTWGPQP